MHMWLLEEKESLTNNNLLVGPNPTYFPVIPKSLPQMDTTIQTKEGKKLKKEEDDE